MKNVLFTICAFFGMLSTLFSQDFRFNKGDKILEGEFSYFSNSYDDGAKGFETTFVPKFGYFLTSKIAVGASFLLADFYESEEEEEFKAHLLGVGLFGRYYFLELGSRLKTYTSLGVNFGKSYTEFSINDIVDREPDYNTFSTSGNIGAQYFLTNKLALNLEIGELLYFQKGTTDANMGSGDTFFEINLNSFNNFFANTKFGVAFRF